MEHMMLRFAMLVLAGLLILLVGCSKEDSVTDPTPSNDNVVFQDLITQAQGASDNGAWTGKGPVAGDQGTIRYLESELSRPLMWLDVGSQPDSAIFTRYGKDGTITMSAKLRINWAEPDQLVGGTWRILRGTGRYAGLVGEGTWTKETIEYNATNDQFESAVRRATFSGELDFK